MLDAGRVTTVPESRMRTMAETVDSRESWEINYAIRIHFAKTFIKYLSIEGHERVMLQSAYRTADLHTWARDRITEILARAERERGDRPLSAAARSVVVEAAEELKAAMDTNPVCGHPLDSIVSGDEGTCYCGECEREAG